MRIGLLVSGNLGETVLKHLLKSTCELVFVFTDKNSNSIIEICNEKKIALFIGNPRSERCTDFIKDKPIDILISVNYLFIIEKELINHPEILAFNIHGSLLPKYRGRTPHVWAIINNEKETGVTAHLIDEKCDTGDIIYQVKIPIESNDTGATLLEKYKNSYVPIIDKVLGSITTSKIVKTIPQNNDIASFFGKRTPEDGQINWNWQRERIRNWVRAQAYPYPGAFTLIDGEKVVIDEVKFSDLGFTSDMPNGLILQKEPLIVKSPNGSIEITRIRIGKEYCTKGSKFN